MDGHVPASFVVHNTAHSGSVVVNFDIAWREGILQGTAARPRLICVRGQKTAGTTFIGVLRDSIVARPVDVYSTSIELVRH